MGTPRRLASLLTAVAIAWTVLWPLLSAAHMRWIGEPVMLCHQAGGEVSPGEAPRKPARSGEPVQHCPLCLFAFHGGFGAPPEPPAATHFVRTAAIATDFAPPAPVSQRYARLPRAPPTAS